MKEATAAVLLLLALAAVASGHFVRRAAGLAPLGAPDSASLDSPPDPDDREAPRFLAERNQVELVVPREMTVDELLRTYQIDFPHVLRQIAKEEGIDHLSRERILHAGSRIEISLTPEAEDVP